MSQLSAQAAPARRIVGPIPPRDKEGKVRLKDIAGLKPVDLQVYEPNREIDPEAIKGLHLYEVDLDGEPILQIYARDDRHAIEVYKKEWGVKRFGEIDPKVRKVS